MIVIIDYGMGNTGSIFNRLRRLGVEAKVSSEAADLERATKLILPGIGFFASGMDNLRKNGLLPLLERKVLKEKTPILGICLGMQLFTRKSEEGNTDGLGWINAETKKFDFDNSNTKLRIPHIGWKLIDIKRASPITEGLSSDAGFYFVHSYYVNCNQEENIIATANYGYDFVSVIQKEHIFGTQFHPEKSHKNGIALLRNFAERV
jgi:glutamine amidotransferase